MHINKTIGSAKGNVNNCAVRTGTWLPMEEQVVTVEDWFFWKIIRCWRKWWRSRNQ